MKGFNSALKKTCGAMLENRGFKRFRFHGAVYYKHDVVYYKVVNDVIFSVAYELMPKTWARRCRMYFGVTPLCVGIELKNTPLKSLSVVSPYNLKNFTDLDDVFYYTLTDNGLNACMEEISDYMVKYMFPFFDRVNSCKTVLNETINLEKFLYDVKKNNLS